MVRVFFLAGTIPDCNSRKEYPTTSVKYLILLVFSLTQDHTRIRKSSTAASQMIRPPAASSPARIQMDLSQIASHASSTRHQASNSSVALSPAPPFRSQHPQRPPGRSFASHARFRPHRGISNPAARPIHHDNIRTAWAVLPARRTDFGARQPASPSAPRFGSCPTTRGCILSCASRGLTPHSFHQSSPSLAVTSPSRARDVSKPGARSAKTTKGPPFGDP